MKRTSKLGVIGISCLSVAGQMLGEGKKPNILFIMSDDHASQAISCYGKEPIGNIVSTPNIDRIGNEGVRLNNCFVTNSISAPSRAAILTGQYSQCNGVYTLKDELNPSLPNFVKELDKEGYQTAIIGKWHLDSEPSFFDYYNVLIGQGIYHNPPLVEKGKWTEPDFKQAAGEVHEGHSTDIIADEALKWLEQTSEEEPFMLMCHFKAPHRSWEPAERFKSLYEDIDIPEPDNILDAYEGKVPNIKKLRMMLENLNKTDLKEPIPADMTTEERRHWAYQIYLKDYLRCVAGVDENVGRLLKYLEDKDQLDNTIIVYTSDQGFFLGEHGFFDKRLMYEEAIKMPFLIRYPKKIQSGKTNEDIIMNVDFAPTLLDFAGIETPDYMQGRSFLSNLQGNTPEDWRSSMYYRYWMHADGSHNVTAHYGIRDKRYKLIFFYGQPLDMKGVGKNSTIPAWEFYDLEKDPSEMHNLYHDPAYKEIIADMKLELLELKKQYKDEDSKYPEMTFVIDNYWEENHREPRNVLFDVDFSTSEWLDAFADTLRNKGTEPYDVRTVDAVPPTVGIGTGTKVRNFIFNGGLIRDETPFTSVSGKEFQYSVRFRNGAASFIEFPKVANAGRVYVWARNPNATTSSTLDVGARGEDGMWKPNQPLHRWTVPGNGDYEDGAKDIELFYDINSQDSISLRIFRNAGQFMQVYRVVLEKYGDSVETGIADVVGSSREDCWVVGRIGYLSDQWENADVAVLDLSGKTVRKLSAISCRLHLDNLPSGMYLLKLTKGTENSTQKIILN